MIIMIIINMIRITINMIIITIIITMMIKVDYFSSKAKHVVPKDHHHYHDHHHNYNDDLISGRRSKAEHVVPKDAEKDLRSGQLQHGSGQQHLHIEISAQLDFSRFELLFLLRVPSPAETR